MLSIKNSLSNLTKRDGGDWFANPRHRLYAIVAAAIWFFGCLLWGAPATLMAALLKPLVPQLDMQILEGGFWRGRAGEVYWRQDNQRIALGSVEWQLNPLSLLWLHPSAHVAASYGPQFVDTRVRLSPLGSMQLRDVHAALPVTALTHWLPMPADGLLGLKLTKVEMARNRQLRELAGEAQWQQATWQWNSRWVTLGDYRCQLSMKPDTALNIAIQGEGALAASGGAQVNLREKNYALQLQVTPSLALPQEMRDGLVAILGGERDAQGNLQVKRTGKW